MTAIWRRSRALKDRRRPSFHTASALTQATHHPAQRDFSIVSLEPARHREPRPASCLRVARAFQEQIRVAPELVGGRERDGVDSCLERGAGGAWKAGDPVRKRSDELPELAGRQGAI